MSDKNTLCYKYLSNYDETKIYKDIPSFVKNVKSDYPFSSFGGLYRVFDDSSEEEVCLYHLIDLGYIEENKFDENLLIETARCAIQQAKDSYEQFSSNFKGGGFITGCIPSFNTKDMSVEDYVAEHKKENKYRWVK